MRGHTDTVKYKLFAHGRIVNPLGYPFGLIVLSRHVHLLFTEQKTSFVSRDAVSKLSRFLFRFSVLVVVESFQNAVSVHCIE